MPQNNEPQPEMELQLDPNTDLVIKAMPGVDKIRIIGPIANRAYCIYQLELAKQAIMQFRTPEEMARAQQAAQGGLVLAGSDTLNQIPTPDFQTGRRR